MRRIRRPPLRWLVATIAVMAAFGGVAGAWAGTWVTPTYAATTSILVGDLDRPSLANDFSASGAIATLYGDMIRGDAVLGPVIDRLGLAADVQELRERVHVDLDPNGIPIITITVYSRTAAEATTTARAITQRMMELSRGVLTGAQMLPPFPPSVADARDLEVSIARMERNLARLRDEARSAEPAHRGPLERRIERQSGLLMLLQDDYRRTARGAAGSVNEVQLLQPAEAKPGRIRPIMAIDAVLGAMIAALAGCVVFVALTIRRRSGVWPASSAPVLVRDAWARELSEAAQDA